MTRFYARECGKIFLEPLVNVLAPRKHHVMGNLNFFDKAMTRVHGVYKIHMASRLGNPNSAPIKMNIPLALLIFIVLLFAGIAYERLVWRQTIRRVQAYIDPIIREYNLTNIPVSESATGALTLNKKTIKLCVRPSYKIDQLAYVLLHEYAHVLNSTFGHDDTFWEWFAKLLACAEKMGIKIDDYFEKNPYCKL